MSKAKRRCVGLAILCAAFLAAPGANAASTHSLLFKVFYFPELLHGQYFEGPCGVTVRPDGGFYVADYYHHKIESFDSGGGYLSAETDVDPGDGPCGLAADAAGDLFVEGLHGEVVRHGAGGGTATVDPGPSTGIAYDPASGHVYVDDRDHVAVYEESGVPVEVGGEPLAIGAGGIGDGYGVAVSSYAGTAGFVYVGDASTGTIEVFDPTTSATTPVAVIDGADDPQGGFATLVDAALAVDDATGDVFVVYNAQGPLYVHPLGAVAEFDPAGGYVGTLEPGYPLWFGEPSAIAVDDTGGAGQGRVFVTSGNSQVEHPAEPPEPSRGKPGSPGKPEEGSVFVFGLTVITPAAMRAESTSSGAPAPEPEAAGTPPGAVPATSAAVAPGASDAGTATATAAKARHRGVRHRRRAAAHRHSAADHAASRHRKARRGR